MSLWGPIVHTARLVLRPFSDADRVPFAELNAHPLVVESLGNSLSREESDAFVGRILEEMDREGWGLWAIEVTGGGSFVGMVGLHRVNKALPLAPAVETGWRLHPDHWGHGYVTEAAAASVVFGFDEVGLDEIVAFTSTRNTRSQAVMERIGMVRDPSEDFDHPSAPEGSPHRRQVLYRIGAAR